MRGLRALRLAFLLSAIALVAVPSPARALEKLVVFGDSLSDVGNLFAATNGTFPPSPPYFNGRRSNGPVWAEHFASGLGLPVPTPSLLGGPNATGFAFGGANVSGGLIPSIEAQITMFLAGGPPTGDELFAVWGGANDFFEGQTNPLVPAVALAEQLDRLAEAGAGQIVILNLPPLGETPSLRSDPLLRLAGNAAAAAFNSSIAAAIAGLRVEHPDVTFFEVDVHGLFSLLISDPGSFGLTNVTEPALTGTSIVPNAEEYLFLEGVHPTARAHELLAGAALQVIPEPGSIAAICTYLLMLAARRRSAA